MFMSSFRAYHTYTYIHTILLPSRAEYVQTATMEPEEQQQQLQEPVIKPLVTLILKTDAGSVYPLRCVVSGVKTHLCDPRFFIMFYGDRMRSLFAEWVSTANYIENPPSPDEREGEFEGVFAADLPLMHASDTLTIHYLKRELFLLMNDDSQATIVRWAEDKLEALSREYEQCRQLFINEALYTYMSTYISTVLESHLSADKTTQTILRNNATAIQQLRNASEWRWREWIPHMDHFMSAWRREVHVKLYGDAVPFIPTPVNNTDTGIDEDEDQL